MFAGSPHRSPRPNGISDVGATFSFRKSLAKSRREKENPQAHTEKHGLLTNEPLPSLSRASGAHFRVCPATVLRPESFGELLLAPSATVPSCDRKSAPSLL